ncbi:nitrophenyl compound nitroreductase subunit ArsF family protein [Chloroflexota bacterium]
MKKSAYCLLLGALLTLFPLTASCQQVKPAPTADIEPAFELQVDLLGASHILLLDNQGNLINPAKLTSDDGMVSMSIDKDSRIQKNDESPLSSIQFSIIQEPSFLIEDANLVSSVYYIDLHEAAFDRPIELTLGYNTESLPNGTREKDICIARYTENEGWKLSSYKLVDESQDLVSGHIYNSGIFAAIFPAIEDKQSPPQPVVDPNVKLEIAYFYRIPRCNTCEYAESTIKFTLDQYYAKELQEGKILFKAIDINDKENEAIVEHYDAYTSSMFIKTISNGKEKIDNIIEIWFYVGKDAEFIQVVDQQISLRLKGK